MPERLVAFSKADIRVMVLVSLRQRSANGLKGRWDSGRKRRAPSPPSEPDVRFSRDGLSSQLFAHRDWRALEHRNWAKQRLDAAAPSRPMPAHEGMPDRPALRQS